VEESRKLAEAYPIFDIVVTAARGDEPSVQPTVLTFLEGQKIWLVDLGHKGMYSIVVGIPAEAGADFRFQRVPLDSRFESTSEIKELMDDYQAELKAVGFDGLGLIPVVHPKASDESDANGHFVGASGCKDCHKKAYRIWYERGLDHVHAHANATKSIVNLGRQYDPECLSCHTTGWEPQKYFPYVTGFQSLEQTPDLVGNGCENCHGPGAAHVAAELGNQMQPKLEFREAMKITRGWAATDLCIKCHDPDNSPEFDFEKYWPLVEHRGKD
jgi:hypothetical protein